MTSILKRIKGWNTMIKIGCKYLPKVTRLSIGEYPKYFQVGEVSNTFYRFLSKKDLTTMAKNNKKFPDFEYILKVNRFITHKYQFQHSKLRDEALETMEKMKAMANELKCTKMLIQPHFSLEFNDFFFKNLRDFFSSIDLSGFNLFWEIRGLNWRDKKILPKLEQSFTELNIGHTIDLLFANPLNFIEDKIVYTRLHGFGASWNNYLHKFNDLITLIKRVNTLLQENKEAYVIFPTEEMYNDATLLKKLWDEIGTTKTNLNGYRPSIRNDFLLNYSFSGDHLSVFYSPPYAIKPSKDKIKISTRVFGNMQKKIDEYIDVLNEVKSAGDVDKKLKKEYFEKFRKLGEYLRKYLLGDIVNIRYRLTNNNSIIIENNEQSLCYPYEWVYDGRDYACLKNNLIRKVTENEVKFPSNVPSISSNQKVKLLFLNKTQDKASNEILNKFSLDNSEIVVLNKGGYQDVRDQLTSGYDIISYLGTINSEDGKPALRWSKSPLVLPDLLNDMKQPPKLFIIGNLLQQQKMRYLKESFNNALPVIKANGNFLTNFVTLSRAQLIEFILEFYHQLFNGPEIAIALKNTRRKLFERYWGMNPSWLCFSLFGDETFRFGGSD